MKLLVEDGIDDLNSLTLMNTLNDFEVDEFYSSVELRPFPVFSEMRKEVEEDYEKKEEHSGSSDNSKGNEIKHKRHFQ